MGRIRRAGVPRAGEAGDPSAARQSGRDGVSQSRRLDRAFYGHSTLTVARALIGLHLVHRVGAVRRVGRIVETEAYLGPADRAAHSARGRTARTTVMFGPPGYAYVYFIYGMWHCLNVVTGDEGVPHAVLLRALEPLAGLEGSASGPGLLCRAMNIDRRHNGLDLCGNALWIERPAAARAVHIGRSARIGIDHAGEWATRPWRFFDRDSPFVSGRRSRASMR